MSSDSILRLRRQEAEFEAEKLIKARSIISLPVDPLAIAEGSQIVVQPKPTKAPGVSGFLVRRGNVFGIMYAIHVQSQGFINFTVAHELGHYFLPGHPQRLFPDGDGVHQSRSGFISNDMDEMQADHFAAALLMPQTLFRPALRKAGCGFAAVEALAGSCKTSLTATAIRYAQFAEDPVAVFMSDGQKVNYCFMSESLADCMSRDARYQKGKLVPPSTPTARFNQDATNVREARRAEGVSSLADWFDDAPDVEMQEDVVGLGDYGRTLTVLFSDEPIERDEEDLDNE